VDRIQPLYAELATDEHRNRLILDDVRSSLAEGRSPILLTERRTISNSLRPAFMTSSITSLCCGAG
jgi:hypothetical protein